MSLVFCDLETTGLSSSKDRILEIAVIVTDDRLEEIARFHRVTAEVFRVDLADVDPFVRKMHAANGLWGESIMAGETIEKADEDLFRFLWDHVPELSQPNVKKTDYPQLAGNTVSFDRNFLERWMPTSFKMLHYRNLDVSSLNEMAKRFWPAVWESRPRQGGAVHRAMPDIEESLRVARHYAAHLGPITTKETT